MFNSNPFTDRVPREITLGAIDETRVITIPPPKQVTSNKTNKKKKKTSPKITTNKKKPCPRPLQPVSSPGRILAQRRAAQAKGQVVPPLRVVMKTLQEGDNDVMVTGQQDDCNILGLVELISINSDDASQMYGNTKMPTGCSQDETDPETSSSSLSSHNNKDPLLHETLPYETAALAKHYKNQKQATCTATTTMHLPAPQPRTFQRWYTHMLPVAEPPAPPCDGTILTADSSLSLPTAEQRATTKKKRRLRGKEFWEEFLCDDWDQQPSRRTRTPWNIKRCRKQLMRTSICLLLVCLTPAFVAGIALCMTLPRRKEADSDMMVRPWMQCQCHLCTSDVWHRPVYSLSAQIDANSGTSTCGSLIAELVQQQGQSWDQACLHVATEEFPATCGACVPACQESAMDIVHDAPSWQPVLDRGEGITTIGQSPFWTCDETAPELRQSYHEQELWLESCEVDSTYSDNSVVWISRVGERRHVRWIPSSDETSFGYGTYTWHVESIQVVDPSGRVKGQRLPSSTVLRFFLHDPTDEAYHVEIALADNIIEESQDTRQDTMPFVYFGWSPLGVKAQRAGQYVAQNIVISVDWHTDFLAWSAQIGSETFFEHIESSLDKHDASLVLPCLPRGPLQVHMLLDGLSNDSVSSTPVNDQVKVKLASFSYDPARPLSEGDICSRDCDCEGRNTVCVDRLCTIV